MHCNGHCDTAGLIASVFILSSDERKLSNYVNTEQFGACRLLFGGGVVAPPAEPASITV